MSSASTWLLPAELLAETTDLIMALGENAFPHNGHAHFYSGPSRKVWPQIAGAKVENHDRAIRWAKRLGAMLIDDTEPGKFLTHYAGMGTFDYFRDNPLVPDKEKIPAAFMPWKYVSRCFALSMWGYVSTTIGGADPQGVYRAIELPHTLNPDHTELTTTGVLPTGDFLRALFNPRLKPVEFINLVAFDVVAQKYNPADDGEATRLVCLGEQRMALQEALDGVRPANLKKAFAAASCEVLSSPVEAYEYFLESQERYRIERQQMFLDVGAYPPPCYRKTPSVRLTQRAEQLEHFALAAFALVKAELELMPPALRPSIEIPECLLGKAVL